MSLGYLPLLKLKPGSKGYWIKPCSPMNFSLSCQYKMLSQGTDHRDQWCCGWVNQLDKDCLSSSSANCPQLPAILVSHLLQTFKWTHFLFWSQKSWEFQNNNIYFVFCFNADLISSHRLKNCFRLKEKHYQTWWGFMLRVSTVFFFQGNLHTWIKSFSPSLRETKDIRWLPLRYSPLKDGHLHLVTAHRDSK